MTAWKSFLIRALSAIAALGIIITLYLNLKENGLKIAVVIAALIGTWELTRILFANESSWLIKSLFYILSLFVFGFALLSLNIGTLAFAIALVLFITAVLLVCNKEGQLDKMQNVQSKAALGFFYMGLLPAFCFRILDQTSGVSWFVFLLATVFSGDTLAYVFGVLFGKTKIMPTVSPKKTWQGSIGGILGSLTAGAVCWYFLFENLSPLPLIVLAGVAGFFGQFGDFFESLLKRVANIKDSGKIMPGHGGVLDRIDGVLFASPIILSGILTLSHLLS